VPPFTRLVLEDQPAPVSHYCHVVRAGNSIWVSGTVGMTQDGTIPEDVVSQFDLALRNLDGCLKAAGAGPEHVVKVTVFLVDINDRPRINPARQRYFGTSRPASTLVEVSALVLPQLKVEIEAQAIVP
jgi:enamine deaminase RidA (YjgF/YER057c/UK114 family)